MAPLPLQGSPIQSVGDGLKNTDKGKIMATYASGNEGLQMPVVFV